jgi:two-component system alkaline phosphatase synthesis response regulator PhoP
VNQPTTAKANRILVVEDEQNLAKGIAENLEAEGYLPTIVNDGKSGLEKILEGEQDLIILDVMLPEMDGFTVCRLAREQGNSTPILFLTARSGTDDRIRGLEAGGDDYLPKPFHLKELLLRVRVILRRWEWYTDIPTAGAVLKFDGNEFDLRTFQGQSWDGTAQTLPQKEAMILKVLAEHPGEIISREDLMETVWGYEAFPSTRMIGKFIQRLRKRFERDPEEPRLFHTINGVGYRFTPTGETS